MIAAQAAARAHHRELERASKEESLRRSQLRLGDAAEAPPEPEIEPFVPVPDYLLNVPLKDHDSEEPDVDVSNLLGFLNPSELGNSEIISVQYGD